MNTKRIRSLALLALLFFVGAPLAAWAETLTGRAVGITDGDTLTLLTTE